MKPGGLSFHHPVAFWLGCALLVGGVFAHAPMFLMGRHTGWQMVGMPMDAAMLAGMALIPAGLLLAAYGLLPRLAALRGGAAAAAPHFHVADGVPLNRAHWTLVTVLALALVVDVMKPATTGFVIPGMTAEYGMSEQAAGWLAFVALVGTTIGSVAWGRLADVFGRRAAILLSALMFMGTAICGAMPGFGWNLAMCFLMGASAGGLLPIVYTLMAETVPSAHRGWLLVALGGIGTTAGYLAAAGAAAWLEPLFSWRVLWLLGLPTGGLIVFLNRFVPESPRFLASAGLGIQARAVLARYAGPAAVQADAVAPAGSVDESHPVAGLRPLLRGRYAAISWGLLAAGVAWGLVNFGFVLWLPVNLAVFGVPAEAANRVLAQSALLALPGIALVTWLYHRWSSVRALVLFIGLTALSLLAFAAIAVAGRVAPVAAVSALTPAIVALLVSSSGVIAMLIPYAAEIYPVQLRGTGAGVIAAGSKFGGILGAGLGVAGVFVHVAASALLIATPMAIAALMLWRHGVETRGQRLEDIQRALVDAA